MSIVSKFDLTLSAPVAVPVTKQATGAPITRRQKLFWHAKSFMDILGALFLLPVSLGLGAVLFMVNPIFNPGPLLFRQQRIGRGGVVFTALKFRTMVGTGERGPGEPLEVERIRPLGAFLRRSGLDEFPQCINVLRREMSLIGPRPDQASHGAYFLATIPEYAQRLQVLPGMSGLAQIRHGYAVGAREVRAKLRSDLTYIRQAGFGLELWIVWRTVLFMLAGRGS